MSEFSFQWDDPFSGDAEDGFGYTYGDVDPLDRTVAVLIEEGSEAPYFLRAIADIVEMDAVERVEWMLPHLSSRIEGAGLFVSSHYRELAQMGALDPDSEPNGHVCLLAPKPLSLDVQRWPAMPKSSIRKRQRTIASRRALCVALLHGWADYLVAAIVTLVSSRNPDSVDDVAVWIRGIFDEAEAQATATVRLWVDGRG